MGGFGINPDFMSPEEKLHFAMGIHPSQLGLPDSQPALPAGGQPPAPSMAKASDALPAGITLPVQSHERTAPSITPQITPPTDQSQHEAERSRLEREGSGIHQFSQNHHILGPIARIGDVALGALFPGVAPMIPGTTAHHNALLGQQNQAIDTDIAQNQETAKTGEVQAHANEQNAQAEALKHPKPEKTGSPEDEAFLSLVGTPNPDTGKPYTAMEAFTKVSQAKQDVKPDQAVGPEKAYADAIKSGDHEEAARQLKVISDLAKAKQAPERPPQALMVVPGADGTQQVINARPGMSISGAAAKPGETASANRKDVAAHDKAYVQPAEAVEKSYQMADAAFKEYDAARKQGKELPTGAQSMVALSTHLSTTFGNVKGARITKDMIQEHLGARSVSDGALVAIQKLTNGDTLSPDQWTAFHDLIGQSRKISWQIAAKEADRKHIPVDFLPEDLKGASHEPGASGPPKAPAIGTVESGYRFKGGDPADQKNWEKAQ